MKKYFLITVMALIVGFFVGNVFLNQYDDYNGIKVSSTGEKIYLIQYGVFSSFESMEENTISLQNYVYSELNGKYYVYIGVTKLLKNSEKIGGYYKNLGYDTIVKHYYISNKEFLNELEIYDQILGETNDSVAIGSIINDVLKKYEQVVISSGKN